MSSPENRPLRIALAGNPNSGKTSLFNRLTHARQHVGNYPGVTVEKREGTCRFEGRTLQFVDLPGTYSLTAYSIEEVVARDFIVRERPDVVVDVVDASNLERNLYLAVQVLELGIPLVLALNMSDVARARGIEFDLAQLSVLLGTPIVPTVAVKGEGVAELLAAVVRTAEGGTDLARPEISYGRELDKALAALEEAAAASRGVPPGRPAWLALKLLEDDEQVLEQVTDPALIDAAAEHRAHVERLLGDAPENAIADARYAFIAGACHEAVRSTVQSRRNASDQVDAVVTNRVLGLPIFLGLMYLVFQLTFTVGGPPMDWIEAGFGWLGGVVSGLWPEGSESALRSLLVDGIIGGVGGVIIFLPNIMLLFLAIALLEDSGYMARAAFIMDHFMHKIGLHGKSFIPLLTGFGCSIPAIMATRTLENERDRLTTILITPLMSCGARLPIYALIIPAFFPERLHAPMLWTIYMIGILLAVLGAKLLRGTVFKGETQPFVMELPPYRVPTLRSVALHMWERSWLYLRKAGTVILAISIVLWAMTTYPKKTDFERDYEGEAAALEHQGRTEDAEALRRQQEAEVLTYSLAGRVGHALSPVLEPLGFDWRIGTALIGAFAAKEVFVAQLGIVYGVGAADESSETLRDRLRENYDPLTAFCIMLFCLISAPCMATIAVTRRETNSWKWAFLQLGGLTAVAWALTFVVYQAGSLLGIGTG